MFVAEDQLDDETHVLPRDKNPTKVMVWGGIGYDGRTALHVYPVGTKVDGAEYIKCMEDALLPSIDDPEYLFPNGEPEKWVYMQDGAGCHQSKTHYCIPIAHYTAPYQLACYGSGAQRGKPWGFRKMDRKAPTEAQGDGGA